MMMTSNHLAGILLIWSDPSILGYEVNAQSKADKLRAIERSGPVTHQGRAIPNTLEEIVDPKHAVVIVHRFRRDIVDRYEAGADRTVAGANQRILASAREARAHHLCVSGSRRW